MPDNKLPLPSARQAGFGLIELMVAIVLGLLITAAVTAMAVNSLKMSSDTLKSARLNQDLGSVMQIMVNDIRRAGYTSCVDDPDVSPPVVCDSGSVWKDVIYNDKEDINIVSSSCVLYSYNRNSDDVKNANERLGFKLENDQLSMRLSCGTDSAYNAAITSCSTDCSTGTWESLIDSDIIDITGLTFTSTGSKCLNVDATDYWITTDTTATGFPCMAATGDTNVTFYKQNTASPPVYVTQTYDPPDIATSASDFDVGHITAETRQVNIQLEGQLAVADNNEVENLTVSKELNVSLKIRNNNICTHIANGIKTSFETDFPEASACLH